MSEASRPDSQPPPPALAGRIDQVCNQFERAWQGATPPRIEDFVGDVPEAEQVALLKELVLLDVAYRLGRGEVCRADDYHHRFPLLDPAWLTAALANLFLTRAESSAAAQPIPAKVGRYQINHLLGEGGFGAVYLAYDEVLDRQVAIKFPHAARLPLDQVAVDFQREARNVAQLNHPGIVKIYDIGQHEGLCYIVSEYIEGSSLAERMARGRLSHGEAATLVAQVAEALHFAHLQGWIHRDIKPSNILLDPHGQCHVVDFGLAISEDHLPAERGRLVGTLLYMSPEQVRGEGHRVDARTDIYSLGVTLYELLCRRRPFAAESADDLYDQILHREPRPPRTIDDRIPRDLERICLRAMAKRVADRHTTAKDFAEELRAVASALAMASTPQVMDSPLPVPAPKPSSDRDPRLVPKGLRSFDAADAEFFLQLLPGPRDREGLPDSLRFWKTRMESPRPEESFSVGLIYGPSGCGKSSLVKAGLLPRLARHVVPIYLEVTREDTEARLLAALRQSCAALQNCTDLRDALRQVRLERVLSQGTKLCIVLDQFEQWLHSHKAALAEEAAESPLVGALRQADGKHVLFLLMVRDDFWLATSRLFQSLEIPLIEGQNSRLVDLFDLRHARRVLELFGQAYDCLPSRHGDFSKEENAFLDEALHGLSEEGKVICVRLSLFADMMKGHPWTRRTLTELGGIEGLGITFLEETFSSRTAPPEHRLHQEAIKAVLRDLLPEEGTEIRGKVRSYAELLYVSGYSQRPQDFERLLRILDSELRIITPSEPVPPPEAPNAQSTSPPSATPAPSSCYQLTHDYLVPPLREWLTRKQRETRRGRAELLLKERTSQWILTRKGRLLPSLAECLRIALWTRRADWSVDERAMVRTAFWVHCRRLGSAAALMAGFALLFILFMPRRQTAMEKFRDVQAGRETRLTSFASLSLRDDGSFRQILDAMETETDPGVAEVVLTALAEAVHDRGPDRDPGHRQEMVLSLLQKQLENPSLDPEIQLASFEAVKKVAKPIEVVTKMPSYFRSNPSEPLRRQMLLYLRSRADEIARGETSASASKPLRDALIPLAEELVKRQSEAVQADAFQILARLAPAPQVLEIIGNQCNSSSDKQVLLGYVQDLDLASLPDDARRTTVRQLIGFIRNHENRELAIHCVDLFDRQPPGRVCDWLMRAFEFEDQKLAAKESLIPYAKKTQKNDRAKHLGEYIQQRLEVLLTIVPGQEIATSYELEYLIQSIGQLRELTGEPYTGTLKLLSALLENRSQLEDRSILDTVIASFAKLYDERRATLEPLRQIVVDVTIPAEVRGAAATALGEWPEEKSLGVLRDIATTTKEKGVLNLQVAALRSLGKLGVYAKERSKTREEVAGVFRHLIEKPSGALPILSASISEYGRIADPTEAKILFNFLSHRYLNTAAVQAIHAILLNAPREAKQVVADYLQWRVSAPPPAEARIPPDEALAGLAGVHGPEGRTQDKEEALKSITQALAQAHLNDNEQVRRLAADLLERIFTVKDAPKIKPQASNEERKTQFAQWKNWWQANHHRLRLVGSSLISK